jgi:hypothetical protein
MATPKEMLRKILEELTDNEAVELVRLSKQLRTRKKQRNGSWPGTSLLRLAGSFEGPEDLSDRHDFYLTKRN